MFAYMMFIQIHSTEREAADGVTSFEQGAATQDVESLERYIWSSQEYVPIRFHMS
jgi:hypothetical protein